MAEKEELSLFPGLIGTLLRPLRTYPDEKNATAPVGAACPLWPVTVPVTVMLVVGEILPVVLAVVVEARPVSPAMVTLKGPAEALL